MTGTAEGIAELRDVHVTYPGRSEQVHALRGLSLTVRRGEFITVMGPSGSGKTTMLNLIAGLERPTSGSVCVNGQNMAKLNDTAASVIRRRDISYVFQFFNLLPRLPVGENVAIPLRADGIGVAEIRRRTRDVLEKVGLADRIDGFPDELSGGERQRVAIARALATNAGLILADEPTGNLDTRRGEEILNIFRDLVEGESRSIVLVTHDHRAAAYGDRMISLRDGQIADEVAGKHRGADVSDFPGAG